jgi:hypothetical protein
LMEIQEKKSNNLGTYQEVRDAYIAYGDKRGQHLKIAQTNAIEAALRFNVSLISATGNIGIVDTIEALIGCLDILDRDKVVEIFTATGKSRQQLQSQLHGVSISCYVDLADTLLADLVIVHEPMVMNPSDLYKLIDDMSKTKTNLVIVGDRYQTGQPGAFDFSKLINNGKIVHNEL